MEGRTLMDVAVIGCGPAGLAAVHAAYGMDAEVTIFSPGIRSPQKGPLILQRPIPAITLDHPDGYIRQIVIGGSILDYRYKLYGDININIQGDVLEPGYHCWNHIKAYDALWARYMARPDRRIGHVKGLVSSSVLSELPRAFGLVVNTAPLNKLCFQGHNFTSKTVDITLQRSYPGQPPDTTIFNAGTRFPWVRSAWLLGNECTEWLPGTVPAGLDPITISKPIKHDCNCFPHVLGTGRFGAWRNQTWVDTAYYDTRSVLVSMSRQGDWDLVK
jgi:hypothetical protein